MSGWSQYGAGAPKSPLYGIWDVELMTIDGELRPPLVTDGSRWRRVIMQSPTGVAFQRMNDDYVGSARANAEQDPSPSVVNSGVVRIAAVSTRPTTKGLEERYRIECSNRAG